MLAPASPLLERVRALAPTLARHRPSHDQQRHLDDEVVAALQEADVFAALVPRELGGAELAPVEYLELLETLAAGDSATAWCVMTASTSTLLAGYLPRATAEALWPGAPAPFFAGIFAPMGRVIEEDGLSRLSGRWSWASGCRHARWLAVGALAERRHVVCFVPAAEARIVDNWDTLGLAGTGSHDLIIENVVVAPARITSVFDRQPWPAGALARAPLFGVLALGIAGCALGIARAALDHLGRGIGAEAPTAAFARHAELTAQLGSARAYLRETAVLTHDAAARGEVSPTVRGQLRLAASFAAARAAEVVRAAFHAGGGASVRTGSVLGNALRDVETLLTHRMVADRVLPATARAMLGVGALPPDL